MRIATTTPVGGLSAEQRAQIAPAIESIRPRLILVAEDNVVNQRVALRTLQKMGHEVVVASNGRDAVDAARQRSFDLILMDVQMPVMDGFEATAALRDEERLHVPIVAMTAHAMAGDRELCLSAGMDDYLSKPIDADALTAIIEKLCADEAIALEN